MTVYISTLICHGRKTWYRLTADTQGEIEYFARRLHREIHGGAYSKHGTVPHLDLDEHDVELVMRYSMNVERVW